MFTLRRVAVGLVILSMGGVLVARGWPAHSKATAAPERSGFHPRYPRLDVSGFTAIAEVMRPWAPGATLAEVAREFEGVGQRGVAKVEADLADPGRPEFAEIKLLMSKTAFQLYDGKAEEAYDTATLLRSKIERDPRQRRVALPTVMFLQGVAAMRRAENDNCIACRGESSCIVPISTAALHTNPTGSLLAIKHFKEYIEIFPDDLGIRWLLQIAHMTLGQADDDGDPRFRSAIEQFFHSEYDIGAFRNVSHDLGLDRYNQAGGAIMDDFDGDGLLDVVVTSFDPTMGMAYYRNKGDGKFDDRSREAGITDQLGGLVCYQADYNNDGYLDVFVTRGAWLDWPIRPSLLRNDGSGTFTDVTNEAGLLEAANSNSASWGDFDNDGWIDLFVACEQQPNRLYRNRGDGTFDEIASSAGVEGEASRFAKGSTWIDYDNDGYPDLFVNNLFDRGRLYHNERDGHFTESTLAMGIDGPAQGFACWTWDYDNDGWLDIFAGSAQRVLSEIVAGMVGQPHSLESGRLFRNAHGNGFENLSRKAGIDAVYSPMGCNFADFDNDGWLDFYLGTGEPSMSTLVPNRMFKNIGGDRFADITGSSRTGHLQKGHAVACGDWDRDGDVDIFIETGGAVPGDSYHNVLFENPGQGNHWLTVKLVGRKTNRAAIGARIKAVTNAGSPRSIHRLVSTGSSFGANSLQQTIGLADAHSVATLEIYWPASHTTQVFRGVAADQAIEITEFENTYRSLEWKPLPQPH